MFSGSITENRVSIGLPPPLRQWLTDSARTNGVGVPELVRHLLLKIQEEERTTRQDRIR
jgi:hypothetical protein